MKIVVASIEAWRHPRAIKIARTLKGLGFDVELWAASKPNISNRYLRAVIRYAKAIFSVAFKGADLYWIENVPDIIYILLPLFRKKYIYDRRSPWALQVQMEFKNKLFYWIADATERFVLKHSNLIVCVSKGLAEDIKYLGKKVFILPNYPDETLLSLVNRDMRKELGVPSDRKVVIFVGKLSKIEGAPLLRDVAENLPIKNPALWILRDAPSRNIVQKLVRDYPEHVKWFGWVDHKEVPNYLAAADIGIVPRFGIPEKFKKYYTHEGIHKITEYFLFGLPVVASGIAPSKYYFVAPEDKFGEYVRKAVRGELKLPDPPKLTWQKDCVPIIKQVIKEIVRK